MKQIMTPDNKLGVIVDVKKAQSKIKVQYRTETGMAETWFNEADCKPAKIIAVSEEEKKQKLAKAGEEPWKKQEKKVNEPVRPKVNKGLAGGTDQYQG